jgi:hypothetical protein
MKRIDELVQAKLRKRGLAPAPPCDDGVFVRRAYLDVIGTLPEPSEVRAFLADRSPGKREALIDALLVRPEFVDYWTLKWCDLLRVKSEYPINLWPKGVQTYHQWIRESLREGRPYDQFARALLTASGSGFRDGPANFYRAIQGREPGDIAGAVSLTFMGVRLEKCPKEQRDAMAVFFSQMAYKKTAEWKEEIVVWQPRLTAELQAMFPDGTPARLRPEDDPRRVFADWLIRGQNPYFARAIANRVWSWLMGRGIVHEPDDFRADNPPANPELLAYLERELVGARYDLRHLFGLILKSGTYQQSSVSGGEDAEADRLFARYPVRRLGAEVLADALAWIGGTEQPYTSPIPEPFTYIPGDRRSIELTDGSISSPFLEMFGRPARDTGLESERNNAPSDAQRLHLLNSTDVLQKIARSPRLRRAFDAAKGKQEEIVRGVYLTLLCRFPTDDEAAHSRAYFTSRGLSARDAANDLAWALVNGKEFLFRH